MADFSEMARGLREVSARVEQVAADLVDRRSAAMVRAAEGLSSPLYGLNVFAHRTKTQTGWVVSVQTRSVAAPGQFVGGARAIDAELTKRWGAIDVA